MLLGRGTRAARGNACHRSAHASAHATAASGGRVGFWTVLTGLSVLTGLTADVLDVGTKQSDLFAIAHVANAEGNRKQSKKDKIRFFEIEHGSVL